MKEIQGIRWNKVAQAKAKIESGFYDDSAIVEDICRLSADSLITDIENCPNGKEHGDLYRDLVAAALCKTLGEDFDLPLVAKEFGIEGGRVDLEFPLKYESFGPGSLWEKWQRTYDLRSIVVETKNLKKKSSIEDFRQLESYIRTANRGRLGFLVSRNGFTKNALKFARNALVSSHSVLMLPVSDQDLCGLLSLSKKTKSGVATLLRRKETMLLQLA